jgi:uncharacterized protein YdiU (UPF0061 family)
MDHYDPEWTPNKEDEDGRYRFENQPAMAQWALSRLGQCLVNLVGESWAQSSSKPSDKEADSKSIPNSRRVPMGFLFNATKSENIVREVLAEFETKFSTKYGEIMCQKLGIQQYDSKDYETLINPLLELLATTSADYTLFFRALCDISLSEPLYSEASKYDPIGKHSVDELRQSNPTDCLGILLKSLQRLQDADTEFVQSENEQLLKPQLSDVPIEKVEPLPFPTLEDVANTWKLWLPLYRSRLLSHVPVAQRSNPQIVTEQDIKRQSEMKKVNPKVSLRSWILKDLMQITRQFTPEFEVKVNTSEDFGSHSPSKGIIELENLYRVLVDEVFEDGETKYSQFPDMV